MSSAKTEETKQEKKSNGRSIFRRGSSRRVVKDDDSEPEMDRAESRDLDAPPEEDNQRGAGVSRGRNRHEEAEEKKKKRKEDLKKQQTCLYPDCKGKKRTDFDTCYKHRLNPRCAGDSEVLLLTCFPALLAHLFVCVYYRNVSSLMTWSRIMQCPTSIPPGAAKSMRLLRARCSLPRRRKCARTCPSCLNTAARFAPFLSLLADCFLSNSTCITTQAVRPAWATLPRLPSYA